MEPRACMFTLLRDDVTRSHAPHVALPGNMKGSEQEALQWPKEQTAARRGPKTARIRAARHHGGHRQR